jgi:hypothetical protein
MSNTLDDYQLEMMMSAFNQCKRILHVLNFRSDLKSLHVWTRLETMLNFQRIDSCWFYEHLTGVVCDCNPDTEKYAKQWIEILEEILEVRKDE